MVQELTVDDGVRYQCEKCGAVFEARARATEHESSCHPLPYM